MLSKRKIMDSPMPMVSSSMGVVNSLLDKLSKLEGYYSEFKDLTHGLESIRKDLLKFAARGVKSMQVKQWMKQVREMFYDMEDWIDLIIHLAGGFQQDEPEPATDLVWSELAEKIEEFKAQIHDAQDRCTRYGLLNKALASDADLEPSKVIIDPNLLWGEKTDLVALEGPENELVNHLMDKEKKLKVVSVLGMGGLGKTTLAKQLYGKLQWRFECRAFVYVGRNPSIKTTLINILYQVLSLPRYKVEYSWGEKEVISTLWEFLGKNRYFIVIDDIWSIWAWSAISCTLPDNNLGSRILTTTRIDAVAKSCCVHPTDFVHPMKALSECDSKRLLLNRISVPEKDWPFDSKICDNMLKLCGGKPLAIIVTAGLLAAKCAELGQQKMLEKPIFAALDQYSMSEGIKKILDISFADLSLPVKSCLLYLSTFPEDYIIKKDHLIRIWVAEGFIPKRDEESLWETGDSYFNELIGRRLIQPVFLDDGYEYDGGYHDDQAVGFTVHAVILDFIVSLSSKENFVTPVAEFRPMSFPRAVIRRLSLNNTNHEDDILASSTVDLRKVRLLSCFGGAKEVPDLLEFRFLRMLDLNNTMTLKRHHLESIGRLFLLRYLGLRGSGVTVLPEEIGQLQHMEILDLRRNSLGELPASIVGLRKLVCLLLDYCERLPRGVENMPDLEELTIQVDRPILLHDVAEIVNSKRLRILGVRWSRYSYDQQSVMSFLDEVGNSSLQSLLLEGYPNDLLDLLVDSSVPLHHLRRFELTISGTLFRGVPPKMASLVNLTHVHIKIDRLEMEGLRVLGDLPNLILLNLHSEYSGSERVIISRDGFLCLVVFSYTCPWMGLQFTPGAVPQLRRLRFEFNAQETGSWYGDFDFGIHHLSCLTRVHATFLYSAATDLESDAAEAAIREQVSKNPNTPVLELKREELKNRGSDADSALAIVVSNHPRNPRINVQGRSMVTKEKLYGILEELDEIHEEDPHKHYGTQDGESGEDENKQTGSMARREQEHGTLVDQDEIMEDDPDEDSGEDENKQTGIRVSTLPESSSHLPVPEHKKDESKPAIVEDAMVSASTGAINSLLRKLATLMREGYAELGGMREEVKILKDQLGTVSAFLDQLADMSELSMQMKACRNQMREMTYDIEDRMDEIMLHFDKDIHQATRYSEKWVGLLKRVGLLKQKRPTLGNIIHQIRDLEGQVGMFDLREMHTLGPSYVETESRLPTAYCKAVGLVGMDGPRDELVRQMMTGEQQQVVLFILGPGGLGKTTLAKEVRNKIGWRFDCQVFVPVPQKIGITSLLKNIVSQLTREPCDDPDMESADLINFIRGRLQRKRYLVVIDGVWSVSTWEEIKSAFPDNNGGSRVIVTTRVSELPESCGSISSGFIHHMRPLPAQDSQILFRSIIFGSERSCPVALKKIADKILEACGGVPLAIIIIAGLLASKPAQVAQWEMVEKRMDPAGKGDLTIQGMNKILDICYSDLPRRMKSCLLYLSVFPENHVIRKDRIIWRWITEGLIPISDAESLWETGESYFQELISRKLIEQVEDKWDEKPLGCKVHGLILEFITSLSNEEDFVTTDAKATFMQHGVIRRLTVYYDNQEEDNAFRPTTKHLSKLRSLTISGDVPRMGDHLLSRKHFRVGLKFLRVLDLEDAGNLRNHHVEGIEGLVLLRYLGLGGSGICKLPEEIGELQHLETLDLRRTTRLRILPASIVGLRKLVRLLLSEPVEPPEEIWKMPELEEVSTIDVGSSSSLNSMSKLLIMSKRLRMLGVSWGGYSCDRRSVMSFLNRVGKSSLQSLLLDCYPGDLIDLLLDSWVPPLHLRRFELTISVSLLGRVPHKMASLVNLTHLRIRIDRVETEGARVLGALPNLMLLNLHSAYSAIERLIISRDGFRCLVVFSYTCPGMGLQFTPGAMPQLRRLWIEFYAKKTKSRYGGFDFGIQHLSCLTRVHATIRCWGATELESVDAAEAAIREQVSNNPNTPVLEFSTKSRARWLKSVKICLYDKN